MKTHIEKHHRILGFLGALAAFVIAIIYLLIVPEEISKTNWLQKAVLSYGHSVCWFLLSVASAVWAVERKNKWSLRLMYAALVAYIIFVGTLLFST